MINKQNIKIIEEIILLDFVIVVDSTGINITNRVLITFYNNILFLKDVFFLCYQIYL